MGAVALDMLRALQYGSCDVVQLRFLEREIAKESTKRQLRTSGVPGLLGNVFFSASARSS